MAMSDLTVKQIEGFESRIIACAKSILGIQPKSPTARCFFTLPFKHGGLGLPSLRIEAKKHIVHSVIQLLDNGSEMFKQIVLQFFDEVRERNGYAKADPAAPSFFSFKLDSKGELPVVKPNVKARLTVGSPYGRNWVNACFLAFQFLESLLKATG